MIDTLLWTLIAIQIVMGGFDTLFHHELTERLAWRTSQAQELKLHGVRNLAYGVIFFALGWLEPHGWLAIGLMTLLLIELGITLWDFVEEDQTRKLPASERINHTLLTLNYGAILVLAAPILFEWAARPTGLAWTFYGLWSWMVAVSAVAVALFGVRDLLAADRATRLHLKPAAPLAASLPAHRHVLVIGGTGFIGTRLTEALSAAGHDVTVCTRDRNNAQHLNAPIRIVTDLDQLPEDTRLDAIIDLAGAGIADWPWTAARRKELLRSRLNTTYAALGLVKRMSSKPEVFIKASAIGWYGIHEGDEELTEASQPNDCFSHRLCRARERVSAKIMEHGVRTVDVRIGLVLGKEAGLLAKLLMPFEFGLGGPIGSGRQWMSWITRDDLVRLITHIMATRTLDGPVNGTAPHPVTNRGFAHALGRALGRPAVIPVPAWPLRALLGDYAKELLLGGARVVPAKALASGFRFQHPCLQGALNEITGARAPLNMPPIALAEKPGKSPA